MVGDEGDSAVDDAKLVGLLWSPDSVKAAVEDELPKSVCVVVDVVSVVVVVTWVVFVTDSVRLDGELLSAVSGQFGNAQGSVEQHPRKLFREHR